MKIYNPLELSKGMLKTPTNKDVTFLRNEVTKISKKDIDKEIKHEQKEKKGRFTSSPFVQYFHAVESRGLVIDLQTALQINLRPLLELEIAYRLKTNQNMNWSIFGEPGSGKSLAGLSLYQLLALMTGVPLKTRNMFTQSADVFLKLRSLYKSNLQKKDLEKNDVIFVDENVREQTGLGAVHFNTQTTEMEIRIRKAMIHFVWVSTILYQHQSTLIMETYDVKRDPEQFHKITHIRLLCYDHNKVLKGHMILSAPDQDIIKAYLKRVKDAGLESYFGDAMDKRAKILREIATLILTHKDYREFHNLANRQQRLQFLDENFGHIRFSEGQKERILGLCKPTRSQRRKLYGNKS